MKAIMGIDISKKDFVVALILGDKNKKKAKFINDDQGYKDLNNWLIKLGISNVKACMEATGRYGERLADFLYTQGYEISVINPSCIKAFAQSKLSRHKTDEVDAALIAEYALKNDLLSYKPRSPILKELKALYRCSQSLKEQHTQVINQLENKEILPKTVTDIWQATAKHIENQISLTEVCIDKLVKSLASLEQDFSNLQTIPGIGKITATAIIAEIPEINSFQDARQLAAFVGITPSHKSSGSSVKGKSKISKFGSRFLRKALYWPAISAKSCNPILKAFSEKLKRKGKHTMVIITAIMRKLLHIVYGVLKTKSPFNSGL